MAEEGGPMLTDVKLDMEMSRGVMPDHNVNFTDIEDKVVFDDQGRKIRFGDIYKDQRTIVIFIRHFLCYAAKEYIDDLAKVPEANFKNSWVKVVVIGCGPHKFIQPFREVTGYKLPMYVDPTQDLHKALKLLPSMNRFEPLKPSRHVKSGYFSGMIQSTLRSMKYCEFQGDVHQQGGAFIFGPGNKCSFHHRDQNITDHALINDLLKAATVDMMNFDRDKRILQL